MTERDELPKGWTLRKYMDGSAATYSPDGKRQSFEFTSVKAIAAAWRIVDAEREAADGR